MTEKDSEIAEKIWSAGIILLGSNTPVAASDYSIGTNHVLPAGGFGKNYSGLSVLDFVKSINIVQSSKNGLKMMRGMIRTLAECEGLPNHYLAVEERFND
jgi:histidinol dehydrogenase